MQWVIAPSNSEKNGTRRSPFVGRNIPYTVYSITHDAAVLIVLLVQNTVGSGSGDDQPVTSAARNVQQIVTSDVDDIDFTLW